MRINALEYDLEPEDLIFFLHVPKAGGTTLRYWLDTKFHPRVTCPAYTWQDFVDGSDVADYRWVRGHFFYKEVGLRFPPPRLDLILLRQPVERVLSAYWHAHKRPGHPRHQLAANRSLEEYLELEYNELDLAVTNTQVRMLGGNHNEAATAEHLKIAKERLESFQWVGVLEHLQESTDLLSYMFGWSPVVLNERLNANENRQPVQYHDETTLTMLVERNAPDMELYALAKELVQTRHAAMCVELVARYGASHQLPENLSVTELHTLLTQHYGARLRQRPAQDTIRLDMGEPDFGEGWYLPAMTAQGDYFRWTGPATTAHLDLKLTIERPLILKFFVRTVVQISIRDSLTVWLNGVQLTLSYFVHQYGQTEFTAELLPEVLQLKSFAHFEFRVSHTCAPHDIDSNNADERQLGLQIDWIQIKPV